MSGSLTIKSNLITDFTQTFSGTAEKIYLIYSPTDSVDANVVKTLRSVAAQYDNVYYGADGLTAPSITSMNAYRVSAKDSTTEDDEGEWIYARFDFKYYIDYLPDDYQTPSHAMDSLKITLYLDGERVSTDWINDESSPYYHTYSFSDHPSTDSPRYYIHRVRTWIHFDSLGSHTIGMDVTERLSGLDKSSGESHVTVAGVFRILSVKHGSDSVDNTAIGIGVKANKKGIDVAIPTHITGHNMDLTKNAAEDTGYYAKRADIDQEIALLVGSSGRAGIWSVTLNKWLLYVVNGNQYTIMDGLAATLVDPVITAKNATSTSTAVKPQLSFKHGSLYYGTIRYDYDTDDEWGDLYFEGDIDGIHLNGLKLFVDELSSGNNAYIATRSVIYDPNGGALGGARQSSQTTIPNLVNEVRYHYGPSFGSVSIGTAYTTNNQTVVPTGWYTYFYVPHRHGGNSGDNFSYGTLYLCGMTIASRVIIIRVANNGINQVIQPMIGLVDSSGYYQMYDAAGGTSNWIKTTTNGLIPSTSGGSGSIGTPSWPFSNGYFTNINGVAVGSSPKFTDTNTTYSAGSNITLSGTTFSLTKANVVGALGYTPPTTNSTYAISSQTNASTSAKQTLAAGKTYTYSSAPSAPSGYSVQSSMGNINSSTSAFGVYATYGSSAAVRNFTSASASGTITKGARYVKI